MVQCWGAWDRKGCRALAAGVESDGPGYGMALWETAIFCYRHPLGTLLSQSALIATLMKAANNQKK